VLTAGCNTDAFKLAVDVAKFLFNVLVVVDAGLGIAGRTIFDGAFRPVLGSFDAAPVVGGAVFAFDDVSDISLSF
jgi:hypothetical protein